VVGEVAEDFTLTDQSGKKYNLYENLDQKILLVFYPKDKTIVCTRQLSNYQFNKNIFVELGIKLVGINSDSEKSHLSFIDMCNINFPLLADENKFVCKKYKALNLFGTVKRKLVLIGEDKRIKYEKEVFSFRYQSADELREIFVRTELNKILP